MQNPLFHIMVSTNKFLNPVLERKHLEIALLTSVLENENSWSVLRELQYFINLIVIEGGKVSKRSKKFNNFMTIFDTAL